MKAVLEGLRDMEEGRTMTLAESKAKFNLK